MTAEMSKDDELNELMQEVCFDPITYDIIDFPVKLYDRIYSIATLVSILGSSDSSKHLCPFTRAPFHNYNVAFLSRVEKTVFETFRKRFPKDPIKFQATRGVYSKFLHDVGKYQEAASLGHVPSMVIYANALYSLQNMEEAKLWASKADYQWNTDGSYLLACILAEEKDYKKSTEKLVKCWNDAKCSIDKSHIAYRIADNYYLSNRFQLAVKWADRSLCFQATILKGQVAYFQRNYELCLGYVHSMRRTNGMAAFLVAHCMMTRKGWYEGDSSKIEFGRAAMHRLKRLGFMEATDFFTGLEPVGRIIYRGCRSVILPHDSLTDF
jgi:hypothetical protein